LLMASRPENDPELVLPPESASKVEGPKEVGCPALDALKNLKAVH
jgi:hypothetical protein